MAFPIELNEQQWSSLVALARVGVSNNPDRSRQLEKFVRDIEERSGVFRDFLLVQWQEANQPLPILTNFPEVWPPQLRGTIELVTRKIAKFDVEQFVASRTQHAVNILVTRDPAGIVGWTTLDDHFTQ